MFCGFCEQLCDDSFSAEYREIDYCGQKGKSHETFYCDKACALAKMREVTEPQIREAFATIEDLATEFATEFADAKKIFGKVNIQKDIFKETFTFMIATRSLSKLLHACLERKSREELKQLQAEAKRLFQEAFVYPSYLDTLSLWNTAFLNVGFREAWAK